jgi:hypothetical protein
MIIVGRIRFACSNSTVLGIMDMAIGPKDSPFCSGEDGALTIQVARSWDARVRLLVARWDKREKRDIRKPDMNVPWYPLF